MSEKFHILACNYIFLMIYATLETVFVNTLLYRVSPEMSIVILYRGITYLSSAVTMHAAAYIGRKTSPVLVTRLGGALYLAMYAVLFFGMEHMGTLMHLTAFLSGAAGAFYWAGHNTLIPYYTRPANRDAGLSVLCVIQGFATLFVPVITGEVITFTGTAFGSPDLGYRVMFGVGMLAVLAQVRYQRKLPPVEQLVHESKLGLAVRLCISRASIRCAICYESVRGFRDGTFMFILNMLLFELVKSESLVGVNAFLTGVMSIFGAWAYGRLVTPALRVRYTLIATTLMFVCCLALSLLPSVATVMIFAMINAFFALFVVNTSANNAIDALTENALCRKALGELLSVREGFLAFGRISGLLVLMSFPDDINGVILAMLVLTASQYLLAALIWLGRRVSGRKQSGGSTCGNDQA